MFGFFWEEKPKRRLTLSQKLKLAGAKARCSYCRKEYDFTILEQHHIKPLSKGGSNSPSNIALLCPVCHRKVHAGLIPPNKLKPLKPRRKRKTTKTKKTTAKRKRRASTRGRKKRDEDIFDFFSII